MICFVLISCAYLPSVKDKLEVRPLNITPCLPKSNPVLPCGWLTGKVGETEDFLVTAGWGKFREIVGSDNAKKPLSENTKRVFSKFAIQYVTGLGYCKNAKWVPHKNDLLSSEGSGDKSVHIRCLSVTPTNKAFNSPSAGTAKSAAP